MTELKVGMKIQARKTSCIGLLIDTITYTGTIEKVNKKSIIVKIESISKTFGSKVEFADRPYSARVKYTYWKTTSDGRVIFKSQLEGIIEL